MSSRQAMRPWGARRQLFCRSTGSCAGLRARQLIFSAPFPARVNLSPTCPTELIMMFDARDRWSKHSPATTGSATATHTLDRNLPSPVWEYSHDVVLDPARTLPAAAEFCLWLQSKPQPVRRTHNRIPQTTQLHVSRGADWSVGLFWLADVVV